MIFNPIFTSAKHKTNYTTLTQISHCIQISGSICKRSTRIQTKKLITVKNTKPTFANFMRHEFFYSFKTQGSLQKTISNLIHIENQNLEQENNFVFRIVQLTVKSFKSFIMPWCRSQSVKICCSYCGMGSYFQTMVEKE